VTQSTKGNVAPPAAATTRSEGVYSDVPRSFVRRIDLPRGRPRGLQGTRSAVATAAADATNFRKGTNYRLHPKASRMWIKEFLGSLAYVLMISDFADLILWTMLTDATGSREGRCNEGHTMLVLAVASPVMPLMTTADLSVFARARVVLPRGDP
jgi:hypothetical protein